MRAFSLDIVPPVGSTARINPNQSFGASLSRQKNGVLLRGSTAWHNQVTDEDLYGLAILIEWFEHIR
jgi:hypothetical protein